MEKNIITCKCKNCGKDAIVDTKYILTSNPPQFGYHCDHCDSFGYIFIKDLFSKEDKKQTVYDEYKDVLNLLKKIEEQEKKLTELEKKIEKLENAPNYISFPTYTAPSIEYDSCDNCPYNMKNMKQPYIGDSPCTWCHKNKFITTC